MPVSRGPEPLERSLTADQVAWRCPAEWLPFETTAELGDCASAYDQPKAVDAVRLAASLRARGYNVYVAGLPGTGRTSTVRRVLQEVRKKGPVPDDLCYVHNFADPRSPRALRLPAGAGRRLRAALDAAIERFQHGLLALRGSQTHRKRRQMIARRFQQQQSRIIKDFQTEVEKEGFALVEVNLGNFRRHELAPVVGGEPVSMGELDGKVHEGVIPAEEAERLRRRHPELAARLSRETAKLQALGRELERAVAEFDRQAAVPAIKEIVGGIREAVGLEEGERPGLDRFLADVENYLLEIFPVLYAQGEAVRTQPGEGTPFSPLDVLRVNLLVDRAEEDGRPLVEEVDPTAPRLCGVVEARRTPEGGLQAGLSSIRPGALHRADGGYLVLNARELLSEEGAWPALRRSMLTNSVTPVSGNASEGPPVLLPEPIPIDVTVVLVGTVGTHDLLHSGDEEFSKLFKVTALFDDRVPLTAEMVYSYACFLARVVKEEDLLPISRDGVARIMEYMVRLADSRHRLSTRFREMLDLAREATWFARERGVGRVEMQDVERALRARRERQGLLSGRIQDAIREGVLKLDLEGTAVGQVNALAVVQTKLERLGYPVRITATVAVGDEGVIDVEREADLSGEIHTKASLILAGYLRSQFARRLPLSVTASICFEQSYGGVEGDSASSAELAALLSALSNQPLRQDLAVTGAVDQHGNVLAVGGINEKIEGFWRACRERGFRGRPGVIIPSSCVAYLQLSPEVVDDIAAGKFRIHPVDSVAELMGLLAGIPFGAPDENGTWPAGSLGDRVSRRLSQMAETLRQFS
ncbi:MAG: ATP-binding protein [Acidobacteria bacterium]|nr:MAG: ATP-binding protein [Acidobacteriota bacterium]